MAIRGTPTPGFGGGTRTRPMNPSMSDETGRTETAFSFGQLIFHLPPIPIYGLQ